MRQDLFIKNIKNKESNMLGKKEKKVLTTVVVMSALVGASAFAASTGDPMTNTELGQTVDYVINKLWSGMGMMVAGGLILASGAYEAYRTDAPKKFGYAVAATAALAGAFKFGPGIVTNLGL